MTEDSLSMVSNQIGQIRYFMYPFFHKNNGNMQMVNRRTINNWQAVLLRIALCNFHTTYYMKQPYLMLGKDTN